jgi:amino acid adenylation domain-containing protein
VVSGETRLTVRELAARASDLSAYLRHLGVARDDCVGLFVEPSLEAMVGVWGILLSGGAYLPLSPDYPAERLRFMVHDSRARTVVAQPDLVARLADLVPAGTTIATLADAAGFAGSRANDRQQLDAGPHPHDLAYVIYTSGSTGLPKGVLIEHRSIVNQMNWLRTAQHVDPGKVVLQKTPLSFDAAQWEILAGGCGSKVVMAAPGLHRDPAALVEAIAAHGVTTVQCVPTLLQALLDTERLHTCTSLAQVFSGGEALSRRLALAFLDALPDCVLVNLYGPTECTINSSALAVERDRVRDGPPVVSIGRPVHNTRYYILADHRSPVAVGETGELYVSGVQLARGYLRRPDLTAAKFVDNPFSTDPRYSRLYRTGDLAYWNADGTVQFVGRTDNQVKLRGFRVELDEVRIAIEAHDWVRRAAVIVDDDDRTGFQNLLAFVELNPKEATLMDQGNHGAHHLSKESRLQTRAQLADAGCRTAAEIGDRPVVDLPGKEATPAQRRMVFARKTYRFFEGGEVTRSRLLRVLSRQVAGAGSRRLEAVTLADLGEILRYFGQYRSGERLLPKYGYASPGALYATQLYVDLAGAAGLRAGVYYYHPVRHQLILVTERPEVGSTWIRLHFAGRRRAIEPVYKNNIREVLEIEAGHMVGLFDEVLPRYGLAIRAREYRTATKEDLQVADEDYYLGTFEILPYGGAEQPNSVAVYVQAHDGKVVGLPAGLYRYDDGRLRRISDAIVLKKHVVAINQEVYERSSFGVTVVSTGPDDWLSYVDLGRKLQQLQMNDDNLGFMSAGYSSRTGNDLPSATRMAAILRAHGEHPRPSYFSVGGRVSDEQVRSEGMKEDSVHMRGPTEMIRDDLVRFLPDYMMPNKVTVLDRLPLTANGKIDGRALKTVAKAQSMLAEGPVVAPRTAVEARIGELWKQYLKRDVVSVSEDFFAAGGNSLVAVQLVNRLNEEFRTSLPLQVLFAAPTIEKLATQVESGDAEPPSRLVRLQPDGSREPVYCWPGLGGYTMNLRLLAERVDLDRPVFGIQAYGINRRETPYPTIEQMAAADLAMIRKAQPEGPYTLWGYSFGARVALETAFQLERSGQRVEDLFLIAPGMPQVRVAGDHARHRGASYRNKAYVAVLFSVFASSIDGPLLDECLEVAEDEDSFVSFISARLGDLDHDLVRRITRIVGLTYDFAYRFDLPRRRIGAAVTLFKARGDDNSFVEGLDDFWAAQPTVVDLRADHYSTLKDPGVDELVQAIRSRLGIAR